MVKLIFAKKGDRSIWWDEVNGKGQWNFGHDCYAQLDGEAESIRPIGYIVSDAECPHQIMFSEMENGKLKMRYGEELGNWEDAGDSLALKCSFRGNFVTYRAQSFTSLKTYLCQDINRGFAFSRCLNGTFP